MTLKHPKMQFQTVKMQCFLADYSKCLKYFSNAIFNINAKLIVKLHMNNFEKHFQNV